MSFYDKVEKFVVDLLEKSGNQGDIVHAKRTVHWVRQLKPEANEALLIAAVAHDIERAIYGDWKKGSDNPEMLRKHQDLSAQEVEKFLRKENAPTEFIERVKKLVAHHEEGGDEDQNVLCDADCLSFFEDKALRRVKRMKMEGISKKEIKEKLDFNLSRVASQKAKSIVVEWYDEAVREIGRG